MARRPDAVSNQAAGGPVTAPVGRHKQPVNAVEWVHRSKLRANAWNPNKVAPPELFLLKLSILSDGWTQPIVARRDGEIIDGWHRWLVSADKDVHALTDGFVPVAYVAHENKAALMMSTVRHNRARGTHYVAQMADFVHNLLNEGMVVPLMAAFADGPNAPVAAIVVPILCRTLSPHRVSSARR